MHALYFVRYIYCLFVVVFLFKKKKKKKKSRSTVSRSVVPPFRVPSFHGLLTTSSSFSDSPFLGFANSFPRQSHDQIGICQNLINEEIVRSYIREE